MSRIQRITGADLVAAQGRLRIYPTEVRPGGSLGWSLLRIGAPRLQQLCEARQRRSQLIEIILTAPESLVSKPNSTPRSSFRHPRVPQ